MKITRRQLRQIIKEELSRLNESSNQEWIDYQDWLAALKTREEFVNPVQQTQEVLTDVTLDIDPGSSDAKMKASSRMRTLEKKYGDRNPAAVEAIRLLQAFAASR